MACINPVLIIVAHEDNLRRQQLIRQVVNGVMLRLRISEHGTQLVALLGKGHERNNAEALRGWVGREIGNSQSAGVTQLVHQLTGRFVCLMMAHGYYPSYGS